MDHLIQTLTAGAAWEELARLLMAACSGAMMGWERERASKPAGLRTHMLVSLGAAVSVVATLSYVNDASGDAAEFLRIDPARVIAGVIGGVGFLGAGSIIEARGAVHGITTAASIWVVAALGTASGLGMYRLVIMTVVIALIILWIVGRIENRLNQKLKSTDDG